MGEETTPKAPNSTQAEWEHASWVSILGQWAWLVAIINGILKIILAIVALIPIIRHNAINPLYPISPFWEIWRIIWGIVIILIGFIIIKPKFSNKCAAKDWDALYNWVLNLGKLRLPWMLVWGVIIEIFGWWYWAGLLILIPAFVLLFAGPREYKWLKE